MWGTNLKAQLRERLRRTDGIAGDAGAVYRAWGFLAFEVTCPVSIWHGDDDRACPRFVGRWLADVIPGARLHALPEAEHFAIYSHGHEGCR